jgi:polyisoprenoid-binding protein YceI
MKNLLTSLFLVVCTALAALAQVRSRSGELTVLAHGPAGLRIEGRSAEVSAAEETSALVFTARIAAVDTGISLRNRHLRESLESDRFPLATLRVPRAALTFPSEVAPSSNGSAEAELTVHGETHPVTVRYRASRDAAVTRVNGSLQFDLRDFGIAVPSYLGMAVAPKVEVEADLEVELP